MQGKPYFMHVPRSTNNAKLWAFQPDMTAMQRVGFGCGETDARDAQLGLGALNSRRAARYGSSGLWQPPVALLTHWRQVQSTADFCMRYV